MYNGERITYVNVLGRLNLNNIKINIEIERGIVRIVFIKHANGCSFQMAMERKQNKRSLSYYATQFKEYSLNLAGVFNGFKIVKSTRHLALM